MLFSDGMFLANGLKSVWAQKKGLCKASENTFGHCTWDSCSQGRFRYVDRQVPLHVKFAGGDLGTSSVLILSAPYITPLTALIQLYTNEDDLV